jgi:hypothetical protein
MFTPSHWGQLGQRKSIPNVNGPIAPGRKIIAGKVQSSKEQNRDRANYCRSMADWLSDALCESAAELNDLWNKGAISDAIAALTSGIFSLVCKTINYSLKPTHIGAPRTLAKANKLVKEMVEFRAAIDSALTNDKQHALTLALCLYEFCCDIEHYVLQIRFAYGIVHVDSQGRPKPANRPTNWAAKAKFEAIVKHHRGIHGPESFPKLGKIKAELARVNVTIPDRTLREWGKQIRLKTFEYHIQPKKRQ